MSACLTVIQIPLSSTVNLHNILYTFNQCLVMQSIYLLASKGTRAWMRCRTYPPFPLKKIIMDCALSSLSGHIVLTSLIAEFLKQNFWGPKWSELGKVSYNSPLLHRISTRWLRVGKLLQTLTASLFLSSWIKSEKYIQTTSNLHC